MIATVIALMLILVAGAVITRATGIREVSGLFFGVAFLNGVSFSGLLLFALSTSSIAWSRLTVLTAALLICVVIAVLRRSEFSTIPRSPLQITPLYLLIDLVILATLGGYAVYATLGPIPEYDFVAAWGLKGRVFWHAKAIDWSFLTSPVNVDARLDYPIQLPLVFDFVSIVRGSWEDRWIGLLFVAIAASVVLVIRGVLISETKSGLTARLATLGMMPAALSPWVGIGEGALIAYGCAAVLMFRRALRSGDRATFTTASILLGGCGLIKNEGLAMVIAISCGVLLASGWSLRWMVRLWPAAAMIAPWLIAKRIAGLQSELVSGSVADRLLQHLGEWRIFFQAISRNPLGHRLFWAGLVIAVALTLHRALREEKLLLTTIVLQWLTYMFVYLTTPYPLQWHIDTSWERVLTQLTLLLAFLGFSQLLVMIDEQPAEVTQQIQAAQAPGSER